MNKILSTILLLSILSSCSKDSTSPGTATLKEICLHSGITQSKAVYDGDVHVSGLQFLRKDAAALPADFSGATLFTGNRAAGGAITFDQTQYYHVQHNTYIASYFPAGIPEGETVRWSIDGKTDIMTAPPVDAGSNAAPIPSASLAYQHQLAQIEVVCKAADPSGDVQSRWGNITSITLCNTPASVVYAYNGLTVTPSGTTGNITLAAPGYSADFAPIAVPDNTNTVANAVGMFFPSPVQTFELEVSTEKEGAKRVTIDLGAGHSLERSKKHIITLTFQSAIIPSGINATSTIESWSNGESGSGDID